MIAQGMRLMFVLSLFPPSYPFVSYYRNKGAKSIAMQSTTVPDAIVGPRVPINENYPGLQKIYESPDIYVIQNFLESSHCQDMITKASEKKLERSPVAYAGWTQDFRDLVEISSKGPIAWAGAYCIISTSSAFVLHFISFCSYFLIASLFI